MAPIADSALEVDRELLSRAFRRGIFHGRVIYLWAIYFLIESDAEFFYGEILSVSRDSMLSLFFRIALLPLAAFTSSVIEVVRALIFAQECSTPLEQGNGFDKPAKKST